MRIWLSFCLGVAIVTIASSAQAVITGWSCADDGDGAIVCLSSFTSENNELTVDGAQYWAPGHVNTSFTTDTELDPTVLNHILLDNDTVSKWTDFLVTITANKTFTLSAASPIAPDDWTPLMTQPSQVGSQWIGSVDYTAGTPVLVGDTFEFSYKMAFVGSIQYCQEMTPTPEPSMLALLAAGGLAVLALFRRKRQQSGP